jgi:hypothetical protein
MDDSRCMTLVRALACSSLMLVGCATTRVKPPVEYTLTNSEIEAVENGLRSARHDLNDPAFRGFRAAEHEDGQIDVCGWITPDRSAFERPFIGTLFAGTFAPERFGGNEADNAEILSDCHNRGVGI